MELVLPMYTNFSPKKFGQKCTHYTWQNTVQNIVRKYYKRLSESTTICQEI